MESTRKKAQRTSPGTKIRFLEARRLARRTCSRAVTSRHAACALGGPEAGHASRRSDAAHDLRRGALAFTAGAIS